MAKTAKKSKTEKPKSGFWQANQGFATTYNGEPLFLQKGELVRHGHPILKGREDLFEPAETISRFDEIEQATAAPGEKRGKRTRSSRTSAKPGSSTPTPPAAPSPSPSFGLTTKDIGERQPPTRTAD